VQRIEADAVDELRRALDVPDGEIAGLAGLKGADLRKPPLQAKDRSALASVTGLKSGGITSASTSRPLPFSFARESASSPRSSSRERYCRSEFTTTRSREASSRFATSSGDRTAMRLLPPKRSRRRSRTRGAASLR